MQLKCMLSCRRANSEVAIDFESAKAFGRTYVGHAQHASRVTRGVQTDAAFWHD